MATAEVRAVLEDYLDVLVARGDFSRFFTDDIEASIVGTPQAATGRAAVEQMIRYMHEVAFDAAPSPGTCWSTTARRRSKPTSSVPTSASSPEWRQPGRGSACRSR
jgi:hypothetical protein